MTLEDKFHKLELLLEERRWRQYWTGVYYELRNEGLLSEREYNHIALSLFSKGHLYRLTAKLLARKCLALNENTIFDGLMNGQTEETVYEFDRNCADDDMIGVDNG